MKIHTADFDEYAWLREQCQFRLTVAEPDFSAREVIAPGDVLHDAQVRWAELDGSVVVSDIGGQGGGRGFDPDEGHGAIYHVTTISSPSSRWATWARRCPYARP